MTAFVIALPHWPLPTGSWHVGDVLLAPKHELHLTLANAALVDELQRAGAGDARAWLQAVWEAGDTRVMATGRAIVLHKRSDRAPWTAGSWSVITPVHVPGQEPFVRRVEQQLGRQLPRPPAHVTTHVAGRPQGIGLPRQALLRRYITAAVGRTRGAGN